MIPKKGRRQRVVAITYIMVAPVFLSAKVF